MIKIEPDFMDICQECPALSAECETLDIAAPGEPLDHMISVRCGNRDLCERILRYTERTDRQDADAQDG